MENPITGNNTHSNIKRISLSDKISMSDNFTVKEISYQHSIEAYVLGMNDCISVCAEACSCCWDKTIPDNYEGRAEYVAKRSRTGHTSILEHSNFVMLICADMHDDDLIQFLALNRYLECQLYNIDGRAYLILGGSLRGYVDLYRESDGLDNRILLAITTILYQYSNSAAFEDVIKEGMLAKENFANPNPDNYPELLLNHTPRYVDDDIEIIGMDDPDILCKNLVRYWPDYSKYVTIYDLTKFTTITVLFKNMSRTCTHQAVRHRVAITQESQRYVDYSAACFNSPAKFKPDKYDPNHKYRIRFGESLAMEMTLDELGKAICDIYGMLIDPDITGEGFQLVKEDARAYLPGNVQCKKIYMTFTIKKLLKFLNLREAPAAQAEIRSYAVKLGNWFRENNAYLKTKEVCDAYTKFKKDIAADHIEPSIDEVEDEQVTIEDYLKYMKKDEETSAE